MRRIGFLQVLIGRLVPKNDLTSGAQLGERIWEWASRHQMECLEELSNQRNLNREVGRITEKIANRFVKYASEIGFLTKGTEKRLTDIGRLFRMYHETDFFITQNKGQLILFILALAEKDEFMFRALIQKLHKEEKISKPELFSWFAEEIIPELLPILQRKNKNELAERLKTTRQMYLGTPKEKKLGYDRIKHMIETRMENFVDISLADKTPDKYYSSNAFTKFLNQAYVDIDNEPEVLLKQIANFFNVKSKTSKSKLIKNYLDQYEKLVIPPMGLVYLPALHLCMFIEGINNLNALVLPSHAIELEKIMHKKLYGDAVFLRDHDGQLSHLNLNDKAKKKLATGIL